MLSPMLQHTEKISSLEVIGPIGHIFPQHCNIQGQNQEKIARNCKSLINFLNTQNVDHDLD